MRHSAYTRRIRQSAIRSNNVHKLIRSNAGVYFAVIILLVIVFGIVYFAGFNKPGFSKEDFTLVSKSASAVLSDVAPGEDITTLNTCSYVRPQKFSNPELFCDVTLAVYIDHIDTDLAASMGHKLEDKIAGMGDPLFSLSEFYKSPLNTSQTIPVNLRKPLPSAQCSFEVLTGDRAKNPGMGLPAINNNDSLVITFHCSERSQHEYYPVTYRQS